MTVLNTETRLIRGLATEMARVNLLPPEIAERAAFRRVQVGLGVAIAAAVGVVGLLYVSASHGISSAQQDVDAASAQSTRLQGQVSSLQNVTATFAAADAAEAQLKTAMGDEIRWSQMMNDLSLAMPSNVWLKSLTFTQTPPAAAAVTSGTPAAAATNASAAAAPIGTFTVTGIGYSHDDLALWLESLGSLKTYADPYFSSSAESLLDTKPIVTFSSTANVTPDALSNRYNRPAGG
ncbi:MAG: type pilus assembly protein PilN [Frankiales bacterium]|nr:type pilus assembly protein PilN [Frankiales bacterium]